MTRLLLSILPCLILLASTVAKADEGARATYDAYCVSCHGAGGKGDGAVGLYLNPRPRDFTNASAMSTRSDEQLLNVIRNGGQPNGLSPVMPAWSAVLQDTQIKDLLALIRSFAPKPPAIPAPTTSEKTDAAQPPKPATDTAVDTAKEPATKPVEGK